MKYCFITRRSVIEICGEDRYSFLQGIISNDIEKLRSQEEKVIYALMLTPQGKILYDLFIFDGEDSLIIDCPRQSVSEIIARLEKYKLRSDVTITNCDDVLKIAISFDDINQNFLQDPRSIEMGYRAIVNIEECSEIDVEYDDSVFGEYEDQRISLLIPEAEQDFEPGEFFPLELGFDKFNAIDYKKGCYIGQEVTARTKYRGLVRKEVMMIVDPNRDFQNAAALLNQKYVLLGSYKQRALALVYKAQAKSHSIT